MSCRRTEPLPGLAELVRAGTGVGVDGVFPPSRPSLCSALARTVGLRCCARVGGSCGGALPSSWNADIKSGRCSGSVAKAALRHRANTADSAKEGIPGRNSIVRRTCIEPSPRRPSAAERRLVLSAPCLCNVYTTWLHCDGDDTPAPCPTPARTARVVQRRTLFFAWSHFQTPQSVSDETTGPGPGSLRVDCTQNNSTAASLAFTRPSHVRATVCGA